MVFFNPLPSAAAEPMEDESLKSSGFSGRVDVVAIMEEEEADASIVAILNGAAILAGRPFARDEKARA